MIFIQTLILAVVLTAFFYFYHKNKKLSADLMILKKHCSTVNSRFNLLIQWLEKRNEGKNIGDYLRGRGIRSIGVYGLGTIGERLIEELKNNGIDVAYIVDGRKELHGGRYDGIPVINLQLIRKYLKVQLLIISLPENNSIKNKIETIVDNEFDLKIKNISEIISEL